MWKNTIPKVGENGSEIDIVGFINFNSGLDNLFDFEEEEGEEEITTAAIQADAKATKSDFVPRMVQDIGLEPSILFTALANPDGYVGKDELKYWGELQEMFNDGDVLPSELNNIYALNINNDTGKLDEEGFIKLYDSINELFEDDNEMDTPPTSNKQNDEIASPEMLKQELLDAIEDITVPDKLPFGLDADDRDKKIILSIVEELEIDTNNMLRQLQRSIEPDDLTGDWELVYTSSSAMKFNKGLTGLGGSFPNGKLGRLTQKLRASKFMMDVEYVEHIQVTPATASFDVIVNGSWDLRSSVSLFTGDPSIVMTVEPDRVSYGPTSTRADHWKSLGPMNMLDITYLDDNLRIMRGNTSVETIFVFRRIS
jgi:PAP_fibrillin